MADAKKKKSTVHGAKHTLCRRIGSCLWGMPNCPTNSRVIKTREGGESTSTARAYPAGQHGPTKRRNKLSTYGELLIEKQKLRTFYHLSARQLVSHGHFTVNGKVCDRASMRLKAGDVISINEKHSPMIAKFAKESTAAIPPYIEKDANDKCKATIVREPLPEEIHVDVSIIKVV